jgi:protein-disulfide isomerase
MTHALGPRDATTVLLEFGDFGCPHCAAARIPIAGLVERLGTVTLAWRHFFDTDLHPGADLAAEASEAAAAQGAFWPMHKALLEHQGAFDEGGLRSIAESLGLDMARFDEEMGERRWREAVAEDVEEARRRGVTGTPTFFIDDERLNGSWTRLRTVLPAAAGG